jgi:YD repeat-containing protein
MDIYKYNGIGIVQFADYARIVCGHTSRKEELNPVLDNKDLWYWGWKTSDIVEGLSAAEYDFSHKVIVPPGCSSDSIRKKVIILITPGQDDYNDTQTILNKAYSLSKNKNIMINTVSFGSQAKENLLQSIADVGNGEYFAIKPHPVLSKDAQVELLYQKIMSMVEFRNSNKDFFNPKQVMAIDYADKYLGLDYNDAVNLYTLANANMLTGNYMDQKEDLAIDGSRPDMKIERTYNSAAKDVTAIGRGWRLNYDSSLRVMEGENAVSGKVIASSLNVRTRPYGTILTTLGRGKEVTYLSKNAVKDSDGKYWHFVELQDGVKGYVASWYISDIKGVEVTYGSGTKIIFDKGSNGNYVSPYGTFDKLTKNTLTGIYTLTKKDKTLYRYDSAGKLITIEDKNGNKLNITYASGKLNKVTDEANRSLTFTYPDSTHVRVTDPANRYVEYVLDANKNLVNVFDPSRQKTTYTYYSGTKNGGYWSRLQKELDANQNQVVKNDYDDFGRLVKQYDANNYIKYHIYRDAYKNEKTGNYEKDKNGKVELSDSYINERGFESKVTYNLAEKKPLVEEDSENKKTFHKYYIKCNGTWTDITNMTDTEADTFYTANWQAIENGNWPTREEITDRNGNTTIYERDERGNVVKITNPDKSCKVYDFDSNDNLCKQTDELNKATYYIYDSEGKNLKKTVRPLNGTDDYNGTEDSKFAITNVSAGTNTVP